MEDKTDFSVEQQGFTLDGFTKAQDNMSHGFDRKKEDALVKT